MGVLDLWHSTNVYRSDFDTAALTPGPMDPMELFGRVSGWLRGPGTSAVSHSAFSSCIDLHSFDFQSSASTVVLPLHPALNGKITNRSVLLSSSPLRPQCVNASQVSRLDFFCSTNVSRFNLDAAASTPGPMDSVLTVWSVSTWLRGLCAS